MRMINNIIGIITLLVVYGTMSAHSLKESATATSSDTAGAVAETREPAKEVGEPVLALPDVSDVSASAALDVSKGEKLAFDHLGPIVGECEDHPATASNAVEDEQTAPHTYKILMQLMRMVH